MLCGDFGGVTAKGEPCRRKMADGLCPAHREDAVPGGRPSGYRAEYAVQAYKLCLLGATDEDIADFLDISVETVHQWKKKHPEFAEARKSGKEIADANVADRLYQRAMGYEHDAVKIMQERGGSFEHAYTKHYPPDTAAAIYWLNNRQRGRWSNRHLHEHSGPEGGPIQVEEMSDDELLKRARQLTNRVGALTAADEPSSNGKH